MSIDEFPARREWRRCAGVLLLAAALGLARPAAAQDGLLRALGLDGLFGQTAPEAAAYEVRIEGAPSVEAAAAMEQSLLLYRFQARGAASSALLRRRAEDDVATAVKLMRSEGYYRASAQARIEPGAADAKPTAVLAIEAGPVFTLRRHAIGVSPTTPEGRLQVLDGADYGAPLNGPARAADILAAEDAAIGALREQGRPYARRLDRVAEADLEAAALEVRSRVQGGPAYVFGETVYLGAENVDHDYIASYQPWKPGEVVKLSLLNEYQRALSRTGLFDAVSVTAPDAPPETETLPITVRIEMAPPRSVGAGLRYSTDLGPSTRLSLEHRNLFGAGEKLGAVAEAGLLSQSLALDFRKPQFRRDRQDLIATLELRQQDFDAYEERAATVTLGLERTLSPRWWVGFGGLAEISEVSDAAVDDTAYLLGAPGFAEYDGANDLLNPTTGERLRLTAMPMAGEFDGKAAAFMVLDANGSLYRPLIGADRLVLAARARLGTILNGELDGVPGPRRLYAGGGGSVRGYAQQSIGPLDASGDPTGGRSVAELGVELRAKATESIGVVLFVDAGSVSEELFPNFDRGVQVAVGPGLRYYSPIGPLRLDVGVPLDRRPSDDPFQLYFSIGQAF